MSEINGGGTMRHMILIGGLLLAGIVAVPAVAGSWYNSLHVNDSKVAWSDAGHALTLHSDTAGGIEVTRAKPDTLWGLRQGDEILAVDGHPVRRVAELCDQLKAAKPAAVTLQLRRAGVEMAITVPAADYVHLIPPAAPTPPTPPTPPSGD